MKTTNKKRGLYEIADEIVSKESVSITAKELRDYREKRQAKDPKLEDLYNPENIKAVLLKNGDFVEPDTDQAFQAYYNKKGPTGSPLITRLELWYKRENGLIYRAKAWNRSSIIVTY